MDVPKPKIPPLKNGVADRRPPPWAVFVQAFCSPPLPFLALAFSGTINA